MEIKSIWYEKYAPKTLDDVIYILANNFSIADI